MKQRNKKNKRKIAFFIIYIFVIRNTVRQVIYKGELERNAQIDMKQQLPGVYPVSIIDKDKTVITKIIKINRQ